MSIVNSDKRELNLKVYLSAIGMTDIGSGSGSYSVSSTNLDPQNLRPINYYANINNSIDAKLSGFGITEFSASTRVKQLPSVQNAKISEVYTSPSASSCTFAFGGIWMDDPTRGLFLFDPSRTVYIPNPHPVFNLLYGPTTLDYKYFNLDVPIAVSTIADLKPPEILNLFQNISTIKPFVPFVKYLEEPADSRQPNNKSYDEMLLIWRQNQACDRTTYNIWQLFDINTGQALSNRVKKYEGPIITEDENGNFLASIKTIRDGLNGSSVFVDSLGKGRSAKVKRIFPTSKDALYYDTKEEIKTKFQNTTGQYYGNLFQWIQHTKPANIFYPTKFRNKIDGNYNNLGSHLIYDEVLAKGNDNCGFHIRLKNIFAPDNESSITLIYEDQEPDLIKYPNVISKLEIILSPKSQPTIRTYNNNKSTIYKEFKSLYSPQFDSLDEFDIFVHFAGPVLLVGFEPDQSTWNAIYSDKIKDNTSELEFLFKKEKSYVSLNVTNISFELTYSAIFFDNYSYSNDNEIDSAKDLWFVNKEKTYQLPSTYSSRIKPGQPNYLGVERTSYDVLNPKNFALLNFKTRGDQSNSVTKDSLLSSLINQKFMSYLDTGIGFSELSNKPVSVFGDWRNINITSEKPLESIFNLHEVFSTENTNIYQGQNIIEKWFKIIFNGTIEGPLFLGLTSSPTIGFKDVSFLKPIKNGDISNYVSNIRINCQSENPNASLIKKVASITLSNLDSSYEGWRILELLEHNIIVLTVQAGYLADPLRTDSNNNTNSDFIDNPVFFQGAITDISTTRTNSSSDVTLTCEDLSTYLLENVYFDMILPYATLSLKDCVESTMQYSGFGDYFNFASYDNGEKVDKYVKNLNLRLSPNPTVNQDILIATIYDRVLDKLNIFLSKFVGIPSDTDVRGQATFRWEPGKGFIFDARYNPFTIDELLFTGIDPSTNFVTATPINTENSTDPGWHGLLSGGFTINTSTVPLSSIVETFGFTLLDGYVSNSSDKSFESRALSPENLIKVENALINKDAVPHNYVGFRKKIMDQAERNEIFSKQILDFKHEQNLKIATVPFHQVSFDCYVTRPLLFHGTFIIRQFLDYVDKTNYASTDQYIYKSVDYVINKKENIITASVTGIRQPWTIRELYMENN